MRLARIRLGGRERRLVIDGERVADVSTTVEAFDAAFWSGDPDLAALSRTGEPVDQGALAAATFLAPIARPHQILCVGLNYVDHAAESAMAVPAEPVLFSKAPNSLCGPTDDIVAPRGATKLDYEVELGVLIRRRSMYLDSDAAAAAAIGGYLLCDDVSERAFQLERSGQWIKGKSAPTFNPCGPFLVTPDEVGDPQDLRLWLTVNGEPRQQGHTADMVFPVLQIIRHLSQFMMLEPGDLLNTGTPPGVALGRPDGAYLRPGDIVEAGIDGLGQQRNVVRAWASDDEGSATCG